MAYDNCHRHSGTEASGPSTTTEVSDCVVCYNSCPARARQRAQSQSLLNYSKRTIARQFRATFAGADFPQRVLTTALDPRAELISAQDASFIPKRGKQTFGLGHFFNGCASRAERGLEIATLAGV